jgi:hypothetical protein
MQLLQYYGTGPLSSKGNLHKHPDAFEEYANQRVVVVVVASAITITTVKVGVGGVCASYLSAVHARTYAKNENIYFRRGKTCPQLT